MISSNVNGNVIACGGSVIISNMAVLKPSTACVYSWLEWLLYTSCQWNKDPEDETLWNGSQFFLCVIPADSADAVKLRLVLAQPGQHTDLRSRHDNAHLVSCPGCEICFSSIRNGSLHQNPSSPNLSTSCRSGTTIIPSPIHALNKETG